MSKSWSQSAALRIVALVLLFGLSPFVEAAHQGSLSDLGAGDFWWHLGVGQGILAHHALPHTGLGSQLIQSPWIATSWLFDVRAAVYFRLFGLLVLPVFAIGSKLILAIVTFLLARGLTSRFWPAVFLSAAAQFILVGMPPLPLYGSVLLFAVELLLLMQARRTGNLRPLYWMPLLFLIWANTDVQFVVGLFVLLLFAAAEAIRPHISDPATGIANQLPWNMVAAVTAASILASMITPYGWQPWGVFFARLTSAANDYLPGFHALRFRSPQDYLLLLLLAAAGLALGMRRSRDPFSIALLLLAAFASFHSQRDAWLLTLVAVAVIADGGTPSFSPDFGASAETAGGAPPLSPGFGDRVGTDGRPTRPSSGRVGPFLLAAAITVVLLIAAAIIHFPRSREAVLARVARSYPVGAANYIRDQHLPQPLFNALPWGGFLEWYLPQYPVAIDGRTELYGDDFNIQYGKVMNADAHFSTLPELNQAGTVLLPKDSLMAKALPTVPGFRVAYSDNVAVVLVREQTAP